MLMITNGLLAECRPFRFAPDCRAHRFFCASEIFFRAAADIFRLPLYRRLRAQLDRHRLQYFRAEVMQEIQL